MDVVAGWACGHETVTLTHSIEFHPLLDNNSNGGGGNGNGAADDANAV